MDAAAKKRTILKRFTDEFRPAAKKTSFKAGSQEFSSIFDQKRKILTTFMLLSSGVE